MTDWISNTINALQVQTRQRTQDAAMHHTIAKGSPWGSAWTRS
jgi:hypothetical protein